MKNNTSFSANGLIRSGITPQMVKAKLLPKVIYICRHSAINLLDQIRIGTHICSDCGKAGIVESVEKITRRQEAQYYFKLEKGRGTILIIR